MNAPVSLHVRGLLGLVGAMLFVGSVAVRGGAPEDWITPTERGLFEAVGNDARLRGKTVGVDQKQADAGDVYGQFRMGELYRDGIGVEKDPEKARQYFGKAAAQGRAEAGDALRAMGPR